MPCFTAMVPVTVECDTPEQAGRIFEEFCGAGYDHMIPIHHLAVELDMETEDPFITIGDADWDEE